MSTILYRAISKHHKHWITLKVEHMAYWLNSSILKEFLKYIAGYWSDCSICHFNITMVNIKFYWYTYLLYSRLFRWPFFTKQNYTISRGTTLEAFLIKYKTDKLKKTKLVSDIQLHVHLNISQNILPSNHWFQRCTCHYINDKSELHTCSYFKTIHAPVLEYIIVA